MKTIITSSTSPDPSLQRRGFKSLFIALILIFLLLPLSGFSYPNEEKAQLSLTGVTAQADQMYLTSDNRYLYLGYNNQVQIVDLGTFALASTQPYDFSASTDLTGMVGGLVLSSTRMYVTKDDGKMLKFELSDITAEPTQSTIIATSELGEMAINSNGTRLYIVDNTTNNIIVYTVVSATATTLSITPLRTGANITDILLVPSVASGSDYIYATTDKGLIYYIVDGQSTVNQVAVTAESDKFQGISVSPDKSTLYVADDTAQSMIVLNSTSLATLNTVPLQVESTPSGGVYNDALTGMVSPSVTTPTGTYKFISGLLGVSVFNDSNVLIDADSTGAYTYNPIAISGEKYGPMMASGDYYIYMSNADGSISVITGNPYVTISSVTYSSGGTSLGVGGSVTIVFQSDETGTYKALIGGSVDESGTQAVDAGATGSVTAATDTSVTLTYDANSSVWQEGSNTVFLFVTDSSSEVGRGGTTVTVDTPPPAVTVNSVGFGSSRIYVNMTRLTVSDMSYYNVYASTDADAVVNRTVTPSQITQPSSGSIVTGEITGLADATLYYVSVEAVDAGGNVGPLTSTYPDGSRITGTPELTIGPAQLMNENGGCSLVRGR